TAGRSRRPSGRGWAAARSPCGQGRHRGSSGRLRRAYAGSERKLPEGLEVREPDADEPQRPRPVGQCPVKEGAGDVADCDTVVEARGDGGGSAPDREVRVADFGRDRAGGLVRSGQVVPEPRGPPAEREMELLAVGDVAHERLLRGDRDALDLRLQYARVDAARAVAQETADLSGEQPAERAIVERRKRADRRDAGVAEP